MGEVFRLIIEDDEGKTTVYPLSDRDVTVGRQEGNVIRLMERNVSRRHARIRWQHDRLVVEDLDSYNGIRINGDRIQGSSEVKVGDLVEIGDYHLALERRAAVEDARTTMEIQRSKDVALAPAEARDTVVDEPRPAGLPPVDAPQPWVGAPAPEETLAPTAPPSPQPPVDPAPTPRLEVQAPVRPAPRMVERTARVTRLVCVSTEYAGQSFALTQGATVIGRVEDNDIVIEHRSVSRAHARVVETPQGHEILDLESANGVLVNGEERQAHRLATHDRIELGHVQLVYVPAAQPFEPTPDDVDAMRAAGVEPPAGYDPSRAATVTDAALEEVRPQARIADPESAAATVAAPEPPSATVPRSSPRAPTSSTQSRGLPTRTVALSLLALALLMVVGLSSYLWVTRGAAGPEDPDRVIRRMFDEGRWGEVVAYYEQDPGRFTDSERSQRFMMKAEEKRLDQWLSAAHEAIRGLDYGRAIELLKRCLERSPNMTKCHWSIGVAYARSSQAEQAATHYRKFVELAPNDPRVPQVLEVLQSYQSSRGGTSRE